MKVYSLVAREGEPRYLQAMQGNYWFGQRGYEVVSFRREQLDAGELDGDLLGDPGSTIVYGSVAVVRDAIARAGRPVPGNLDFPAELADFVGRKIFDTTLSEVRRWEEHEPGRLPVHIKPRDRHKLFTGKVVGSFRDLISISHLPGDTALVAQEVIDLRSEWRASVLRGRVLNVANYKGDGLVFPDAEMIAEAAERYVSAPIGYGMDWAVTRDGRTILVEVNDGFALGNYGMAGHQYTALIEARWRQLMGLQDNGVGYEPRVRG